jgi:hypothetical protein
MERCRFVVFWFFLFLVPATVPVVGQDWAPEDGPRFGFFAGLDKLPTYSRGIEGGGLGYSQFRIGAMIEPTPLFLIKPDVLIVTQEEEEDDSLNDQKYLRDKRNTYGGGVSLYYNLMPEERASIYVGPRVDLIVQTEEDENSDGSKNDDHKTTFWGFAACLAGQYRFGPHFSFFAEIGAGYASAREERKSYDTSGDVDTDEERTDRGFYTYGGQIGVAFFF